MFTKSIGESLMRNTWVEIDLDSIANSLAEARKIVNPETKIAGVVKANAYGHGAIDVAKTLIENGVDMLAVACLTEAIELRAYYSKTPILIMGYTPDSKLRFAVEQNISTTIFSLEQAEILSNIGETLNKEAVVHIKINTGLNRLGLNVDDKTIHIIKQIYNMKNINVEGIFTHFALDTIETDKEQFELFKKILNGLESKGINIPIKHVSDSIAMVKYPEYHLDMIRLGSFMYGVKTSLMEEGVLKLAMTFKTQISHINNIKKGEGVGYGYSYVAEKDTLVGTLAVGYADGYMRCLGNIGEVSINGKKVPIIGKICMDQSMVDLTNVPEAKVGDEVVLLGEGSKDTITLGEISQKANTNKNEILSIVSRRVPRVYMKDNKVVKVVDYL